jgi:hypothetical protein
VRTGSHFRLPRDDGDVPFGLRAAAVGLLVIVCASGCSQRTCDQGAPTPPAASFVGKLIAVRGDTATFEVEEDRTGGLGKTIDVRYLEGSVEFLTINQRYAVAAYAGSDGVPTSWVHTAGSCGNGTFHPDGSAIDTGVLRGITWVQVALAITAPFIALLTILWLLGRRARVS